MSNSWRDMKLEPCPFCKTTKDVERGKTVMDPGNFLECFNPKCHFTSPVRSTLKEAVEAWNYIARRVSASKERGKAHTFEGWTAIPESDYNSAMPLCPEPRHQRCVGDGYQKRCPSGQPALDAFDAGCYKVRITSTFERISPKESKE